MEVTAGASAIALDSCAISMTTATSNDFLNVGSADARSPVSRTNKQGSCTTIVDNPTGSLTRRTKCDYDTVLR